MLPAMNRFTRIALAVIAVLFVFAILVSYQAPESFKDHLPSADWHWPSKGDNVTIDEPPKPTDAAGAVGAGEEDTELDKDPNTDISYDLTRAPTPGCENIVNDLQQRLIHAYQKRFEGIRYANIWGYLETENKGDAAIWSAQQILLSILGIETMEACRFMYKDCDIAKFRRKLEEHRPHSGIIMAGGGNFNDYYWEDQPSRMNMIENFLNVSIRAFPQSIYMTNPERIDKTRKAFTKHHDLQLAARDKPSYDWLMDNFGQTEVFHPTDEELITHYLTHKITEADFDARAIAEVDLTKSEPWDLPEKAKLGEKEWYFFSLRDRKYPSGVRTNRATNAGYWKTTGKDKEIFDSSTSELVGMKKTLVFYKGRAPRGEKTNWIMHEYRLHSELASKYIKDEWVVCRVFMKSSSSGKKYPPSQPRANPYYVELGPVSTPSLIQNELMELSRFARDSHGPTSTIQPQLSYHGGGGGGGGGFTLAGMKLNLGALPPPPAPAAIAVPLFQPLGVAEQPPSSAIANGFMGAMDGGFGSDVRYHSMDSATELDVFWSPY